jgi:replication-associated recombination protein RarA
MYGLKLTRKGHNFFDMASMLQKSIRRGDVKNAAYAAYELFGNYNRYLWKRLVVISAEDCYGLVTKEIVALMEAEKISSGTKIGI